MEDVLLWISSGHWNLGCVKSMVWRFSSDIPLKNIFWICSCKKKNTPKPNQNRKQTKPNQNKSTQTRKDPEVFNASILKKRLKFGYLDIYRYQKQQFHLKTGVLDHPLEAPVSTESWAGQTSSRLILGEVGSAGTAASHGTGTSKLLVLP